MRPDDKGKQLPDLIKNFYGTTFLFIYLTYFTPNILPYYIYYE